MTFYDSTAVKSKPRTQKDFYWAEAPLFSSLFLGLVSFALFSSFLVLGS
jgi:hypothetical protein